MQTGRHALAHQPMVGGMELDPVAAKAFGVEGVKLRRIFVGLPAKRKHLGTAPVPAEFGQRRALLSPTVGVDSVLQRRVAFEQVDVLVGRRLVEHLVGVEGRARSVGNHGNEPLRSIEFSTAVPPPAFSVHRAHEWPERACRGARIGPIAAL